MWTTKRLTAIAGCAAILALTAGCATRQPSSTVVAGTGPVLVQGPEVPARPAVSVAEGNIVLEPVLKAPARYQLPVSATEKIGDGALVFENVSNSKLKLVSVEPIFDSSSKKAVLLGTHIVALDSNDPNDLGAGITRQFPAELPPVNKRYELSEAVIEPVFTRGDRYVIVFGLQVPEGTARITSVKVTYSADGKQLAQIFQHNLILCTGRPAGAQDCGA